jgi:hypothetical protein
VGAAIIVLPAIVVFPLGYGLLAIPLSRHGAQWPGLLMTIGAGVYTIGGMRIFALGPPSVLIQPLEVAGAVPYALGFVLLGRNWGHPPPIPPTVRTDD